jgi:FkbM family methyltransferase
MSSQLRTSFAQRLVDSRLAQKIVVLLKLQQLFNRVLGKFPLQRRHGKTGSFYRIRTMESMIVANEIFDCNIYRPAMDPKIETLMDIGCNTGYFSLYCADGIGRNDIEGLAIDANPEMADETQWHVQKNGLTHLHVLTGLAGAPKTESKGTFYISGSNIASSALARPNPKMPSKGELKAIEVPAIDMASEWKARYGSKRIHLLKIDVEGYEKHLIQNCPDLLELADMVVVEIHKWIVTPEEIEAMFKQSGFEPFAVEDSADCMVKFYRRCQ